MMQDPMAGIGSSPAGPTQGGDNPTFDTKQGVFDPMILGVNLARIERIRTVMSIASGVVAGISGLTSWKGFVAFLVLHLVTMLAICGWKMKFDLKTYTRQTWFGYLTTSLQPTALSFTLFWTLFYGLVYLY